MSSTPVEHVKSNAAVYIALVALVISLIINIVVVTRWGTRLETVVDNHIKAEGHQITKSKVEAVVNLIAGIRSDLRLVRSDLNQVKYKVGVIDWQQFNQNENEIGEPESNGRPAQP